MKYLLPIVLCFLIISCSAPIEDSAPEEPINILWLVTEDMGPYIPAFGDSTIETPNLSRLADEGVRYTNFYSPSGVCAPSRAAIATGMYPSSIGANHMRTNGYTEVTGLPVYEAVPPAEVKMFSEYLRKEGYYCTNNSKTDYQFRPPSTAWDASNSFAHWRNRDEDQAFFSIFNFTVTHESGLFEPYGFRRNEMRHYQAGDTSFATSGWSAKIPEDSISVYVSKDTDFPIPPYLPDTEVVRRDMWKMYNNIAEMDRQVGAVLDQLEEDGLLDNTIIFFYADHGGPLPHQKRMIYDAGLKVPLIVRFPNREKAGTTDDQLLSFIDLAPTVLNLAGISTPEYVQGRSFLSGNAEPRKYIHAAADRFDGVTDVKRAVRDSRYKFIRNYRPDQGYYLPVTYRERIPTMQELLKLRDDGKLNEAQSQWFRESKPEIELFDCHEDPHELKNLAHLPEYEEKVKELSVELDRWLLEIGDVPNLPERELISQLWEGAEQQPITSLPVIKTEQGSISINCETPGASIGYKIMGQASWSIYSKPFEATPGDTLTIKAHRIGFKSSETLEYIVDQ